MVDGGSRPGPHLSEPFRAVSPLPQPTRNQNSDAPSQHPDTDGLFQRRPPETLGGFNVWDMFLFSQRCLKAVQTGAIPVPRVLFVLLDGNQVTLFSTFLRAMMLVCAWLPAS